jgi:hypothetical protein
MKHLLMGMLVLLAVAPLLHGQQSEQRPTLGPSEPSLGGPSSATITNQRKLVGVHKVYVDRISNKLSDKIIQDLSHSSLLQVVDKRDEADAILRGTCFRLSHLKSLHSEVYLSDRVTGDSLWQDIVLVPWNPPTLNQSVDKAAARIVTQLFESIRLAQRH